MFVLILSYVKNSDGLIYSTANRRVTHGTEGQKQDSSGSSNPSSRYNLAYKLSVHLSSMYRKVSGTKPRPVALKDNETQFTLA